MFEQEQNVADLFFFSQCDELLLQAQACGVIDGTELDDGDQIRFVTELRRSRSKPLTREDSRENTRVRGLARDDKRLRRTHSVHALMAIPYTLFDASSMASAKVGCAWMVHIKSSTVASSSMAATASAINSVACGPMMCTPRISP